MDSLTWFHKIEFADGVTPGLKDVELAALECGLPDDLSGKTVLDIGCNDGGFSVLALRRNARRVVAIDVFPTDGLRWVLRHTPEGKRIEFACVDLLSEAFLELPVFDVVFFLGVLYHLKHPLAGLIRLRRVTGEAAYIETLVDTQITDRPVMTLFEGAEQDGNPTNWWAPNTWCVKAMLRIAGFDEIRIHSEACDRLALTARPAADGFAVESLWTVNPQRRSLR